MRFSLDYTHFGNANFKKCPFLSRRWYILHNLYIFVGGFIFATFAVALFHSTLHTLCSLILLPLPYYVVTSWLVYLWWLGRMENSCISNFKDLLFGVNKVFCIRVVDEFYGDWDVLYILHHCHMFSRWNILLLLTKDNKPIGRMHWSISLTTFSLWSTT